MYRLAFIVLVSLASAQNRGQQPAVPPQVPEIPAELQPVWDTYEALISEYPNEPLLHYNFGNLAYGTGDYVRAREEYKTALSSGDKVAQSRVYYNLGNSLYRAGQVEQARDFFRKALSLNPTDSDARTNYELASLEAAEQEQEKQDTPASDPDEEDQQEESSEEGEEREGDQGENDEQQESDSNQDQQEPSDQQSKSQQSQTDPVKKEEAEAILNALKANEDLLKRQYKTAKAIKLEKDW